MEYSTSTGFERTTTFKGQKAHEEFDERSKRGSISVMAYENFNVEIKGHRVPFSVLEAAREAIPLEKLEALKAAPAAEGE